MTPDTSSEPGYQHPLPPVQGPVSASHQHQHEPCPAWTYAETPSVRATENRCMHLPENSRFVSPASSPAPAAMPRHAVFLDRDGVIVEDVHYLRRSADLRLLPGVVQALRLLQEHFFLIVVTNQSGIARGLLTEADLLDIHQELVRKLALEGVLLDVLYYCPHLPEATLQPYRQVCLCRKPAPGMLIQARHDWAIALEHSFMVGDTLRDVQAGEAVGVPGFLLDTSTTNTLPENEKFYRVATLLHAAQLIVTQHIWTRVENTSYVP